MRSLDAAESYLNSPQGRLDRLNSIIIRYKKETDIFKRLELRRLLEAIAERARPNEQALANGALNER